MSHTDVVHARSMRSGFPSRAAGKAALVLVISWAMGSTLTACKSGSSGPYQPQSEATRSPLEAERLTLKAVDLMDKSPPRLDQAEQLLREALSADLYHGPAHNNLGVIYLKQGQLFQAAGEFEWARKLLPGHPDPRVNLAMTLERAGRSTDALREYASALEVMPEHLPAIQGLTRLQLRTGTADELTHGRLETIAMRSDSPKWREWARTQMLRERQH